MSDNVRLGLVVGGIAAVLLALLWRYLVVHGRRRRLRKQLRADDPLTRARAGVALVDEGLNRCAPWLLAHAASEPDARVGHAIALAVARRQWEPVNTLKVRQLREWASQELQRSGEAVQPFGPAVTRLADMGGPRPPQAAETGSPATAEQAPRLAPPAAAAAATPAATPTPAAPSEPDPAVHWRADASDAR